MALFRTITGHLPAPWCPNEITSENLWVGLHLLAVCCLQPLTWRRPRRVPHRHAFPTRHGAAPPGSERGDHSTATARPRAAQRRWRPPPPAPAAAAELLRHTRRRVALLVVSNCRLRARIAVFEFIEGFYNPRRRHSSLAYLSPMKFESQFAETSLGPDAHEHAVVLAPVKERPGNLAASRTPACRPSLTAARHDSLSYMQAGTKRCSLAEREHWPKEEETDTVKLDTLIPRPHLCTKSGQAQRCLLRPRSVRPFRLHARSRRSPGTPRRDEHGAALARSGQTGSGPRPSRSGLRLVYRRVRHARSEGG